MRVSSLLLAVVVIALIACSSEPTGPCALLVKPVLVGRLVQRDAQGCLVRVDSIYSNVVALADTFRVCGSDTIRVSGLGRKFTTDLPICD